MILIAAPDASPEAIARADYLTDGTNDDAVFAEAMKRFRWIITEGTFYVKLPLTSLRDVNVDGQGKTTFRKAP